MYLVKYRRWPSPVRPVLYPFKAICRKSHEEAFELANLIDGLEAEVEVCTQVLLHGKLRWQAIPEDEWKEEKRD